MAFTDDLILQTESVTETTQANHTANIKVKDNHRSDKKLVTQTHQLFQRKIILLSLVIA